MKKEGAYPITKCVVLLYVCTCSGMYSGHNTVSRPQGSWACLQSLIKPFCITVSSWVNNSNTISISCFTKADSKFRHLSEWNRAGQSKCCTTGVHNALTMFCAVWSRIGMAQANFLKASVVTWMFRETSMGCPKDESSKTRTSKN